MWLYVTGEKGNRISNFIPLSSRVIYCETRALCYCKSGCGSNWSDDCLCIYNFTAGFVHMLRQRKPTNDITARKKKKKSFMKSTKAQVHKHRSEVHFISTSLKGNKLRSARTPKTRNSLVVEKPRQRMYSWESQVTLPQHILGVPPHPLPQPPAGAHAFNSGCSWGRTVLPPQTATLLHLHPGL